MNKVLALNKLNSGEGLIVYAVSPPDLDWESKIRPFLSHKPTKYLDHIDRAMAGKTGHKTTFYTGVIDNTMVGNAMLVETDVGIGHIGHVFTAENHRKKGVAILILWELLADFNRRNGFCLVLGTEYNSPAYSLYKRLGFQDYKDTDGRMYWGVPPRNDSYYDEEKILA